MICLFVCLSHSCIVLKRQELSTRLLLHTTESCLSLISLKFSLHRSTPSSLNFCQTGPTPVDLSVGDIRWQIAAEWLLIVQQSQQIAYMKPPSLFRMVTSLIPINSLPPTWRTQDPTSRRVLPPGEYDKRYRQDFFWV